MHGIFAWSHAWRISTFYLHFFALDLSSQQPGMRICCFIHVYVSVCVMLWGCVVVCICVFVFGMVWRYGKEIAGERQSKARCPVVFFLLDATQRQDVDRSMNRHELCNPYLWQRPSWDHLYASTMLLSYAIM
jgi:hypothetical protein